MSREIRISVHKDFRRRYISYLLEQFVMLSSHIYISKDGDRTVNAKSMLGLLSLGIVNGDEITVGVVNDNTSVMSSDLAKVIEILECDGNEGV